MTARKPTIPEVIDRFTAYHDANPSWGLLHVVLDDGNTRQCFVDSIVADPWRPEDTEGIELAKILQRMSRTQRIRLAREA